jgi:hypothetical protein
MLLAWICAHTDPRQASAPSCRLLTQHLASCQQLLTQLRRHVHVTSIHCQCPVREHNRHGTAAVLNCGVTHCWSHLLLLLAPLRSILLSLQIDRRFNGLQADWPNRPLQHLCSACRPGCTFQSNQYHFGHTLGLRCTCHFGAFSAAGFRRSTVAQLRRHLHSSGSGMLQSQRLSRFRKRNGCPCWVLPHPIQQALLGAVLLSARWCEQRFIT